MNKINKLSYVVILSMMLIGCGKEKKEKVIQISEVIEVKAEEIKTKEEKKIEKKVNIENIKIEKITEDSARISYTTDIETITYINGLNIDITPKKEHYYYLSELESGKEHSVIIKAETSEEIVTFKTKDKAEIDYKKNPEYLKNAVFYEIFVRAFADSNGDGQGDFNGITENLDYLKNLGIDGIWLMPINTSPSYHGYDVVDYYGINSQYGTIEDFKRMLDEAHKRDIKIVMDLVLNHTGSEHFYFQNARKGENSLYRDWYVWKDEPEGGGWYENEDGKYYYSAFWGGMPDLNYKNPLVVSEAKNIADYWLDIGVDGFRLDAAYHLDENKDVTHKFWNEFKKSVKNKKKDAYLVAENWTEAVNVAPFFNDFDSCFDFEAADMIVNTFVRKTDVGLIEALNMNYEMFKKYNSDFTNAPFIRNHDMNRTISEFISINNPVFIERGRLKMKQAAVVLMSLGGTPYIYYGEEIGQQGKKPDEHIREPFDWYKSMNGKYMTKWTPRKYIKANDGVSVEEQTGNPESMLEHFRKLIKMRKENSSMRSYNIQKLETGDSRIFGYYKIEGDEKTIFLFNLENEAVEIEKNIISKNKKIVDIYNNVEIVKNKIVLEGNGFLIIK